jgi:hypothetical protein
LSCAQLDSQQLGRAHNNAAPEASFRNIGVGPLLLVRPMVGRRVWRLRLLGGDFLNGLRHELHESRITVVLPVTCLVGTNLHAEVLGCLNGYGNGPSTMASLVPRPYSSLDSHLLDTAADQPLGFPRSAVGVASRAGSGRKARDGTYKLFILITSTERASDPRSSRVPLTLSPPPQSNTCAYPIVRLCVSYSNVRSRKNVMVQLHAPQGSRVVEN